MDVGPPGLARRAPRKRKGKERTVAMKFDPARAPRLVAWEATRACDLACVHCRAVAQPRPAPRQLSTDEAFRLVDDVAAFQEPVIPLLNARAICARGLIAGEAARASHAGLRVVMS